MTPLDFDHEYILENDVVALYPLKEDHLDDLRAFSLNEPEIWKYSLLRGDGIENLTNYIALALEDRKARKSYPFIVWDKRSKQYAGSTRFYDFQATHQTTQLGYTWYGKEFQGTGLNKNCKFLMLEFAFEHLNLERVEFRADAKNKRSIAAMKSIGCTEEGILRSNCQGISERRDSIVLSILKSEWFGEIKSKLQSNIQQQ